MVHCFGEFWVDGKLAEDDQSVLVSNLLHMALSKHRNMFAAVRAQGITHIFYNSQYRDIHHFCHFNRLAHDQGYQILRGGYDDDAVQGQGLEYGQGNISRSRRHIHKDNLHSPKVHRSRIVLRFRR